MRATLSLLFAIALAALCPASAESEAAEWHHHHHRRHHHHGHRPHHRHRASLASAGRSLDSTSAQTDSALVSEALSAVNELMAEDNEDDAKPKHVPDDAIAAANLKADMFPRAHPIVARAMDHMVEGLKDLKDKKSATDEGREKLEVQQQSAMGRMMDGSKMKQLMHKRETAAKMQERRLKRLEAEDARIHEEHDKVVVRLHAVMEPRIAAMKQRLRKQEAKLDKAEENVKGWNQLKDKYKSTALLKLQERDSSQTAWRESEIALKKAKEEEENAKEAYEEVRKQASHEIEAYKYASTKLDAVVGQEEVIKERAAHEGTSVTKMENIMKMEEGQLDASLVVGEERITRRVAKAHAARDQAQAALSETKEQYQEWQAEERMREEQAAKLKVGFDVAEKAFAAKRAEVLQNASTAAFKREARNSDFNMDDWAWDSDGTVGNDDELSISA